MDRTVFAVFDVTAAKRAEDDGESLTGEMNHRVKNLLAVTSSLTSSSRQSPSVEQMTAELTSCLSALGGTAFAGARGNAVGGGTPSHLGSSSACSHG
jgi:outer membrane lipoprotein SlyB